MIQEQAAALAPGLAGRLAHVGKERVFVLHWLGQVGDASRSVYLSQRDVRELQFAKAAIATGWRILLEEAGLEAGDIQQVLLAGSFGSYLSPVTRSASAWCPPSPRCGSGCRSPVNLHSSSKRRRWRRCSACRS